MTEKNNPPPDLPQVLKKQYLGEKLSFVFDRNNYYSPIWNILRDKGDRKEYVLM